LYPIATKSGSARLDNQIEETKSEIDQLKRTDSGIEDFIPFGIALLTNLEAVFEKASVETKHQLLGSILAEKLELKAGKYRTPVFKEGFDLIFHSVNHLQAEKQQTGDNLSIISRLVPLTGQFSNSLYANLDEFKALKESLKREGIFDETWETLVIPRRGASSSLPYRP